MPQLFSANAVVGHRQYRWLNPDDEDTQDYMLTKASAEMMRSIMLSAKYGESHLGPPEYISGWREQGLDDDGKYKIFLKGPIEIITGENEWAGGHLATVKCTVDKVKRDEKYDNRRSIRSTR